MNRIVEWVQGFPVWIAGLEARGVTIIIVVICVVIVGGSILYIRLSGKRR